MSQHPANAARAAATQKEKRPMSAYDTLVAEIAEYLDGRLKSGMEPERYARGLVEEADFSGETLHFEIRAFHSSSGAPLPFTMPTPPELRDDEPEGRA